jgi:NAD(P)-dependent dehydrogenase (short-subunit alcohol dehydrogenase family)
MDCQGKATLVVGGGSGIGRSAAQIFSRNGALLVVADVNLAGAEETVALVREEGGEAIALQVDVTSRDSVNELVARATEHLGRIDILANTVGWSDTTFFVEEDETYWQKIIAINFLGSIYLCRAVLDGMIERKSGSIVLTSSDAGKVGTMGETVYAGAKAGVIGFVKSLARETARDGIRVNAISPGPTDTPLIRSQADQNVIAKMVRAVPLKRMGTADEQGNAIVFLASDAAGYITGQTLSVSGGLTMTS